MNNGSGENYQKELDKILDDIEKSGNKKKLLLHSCCAPCSTYPLKYLSKYFDITDFFYNPNISSQDEYDKRRDELKRLIDTYNGEYGYDIEFIEGEYDPGVFFNAVKGLENEKEGGERCFKCYRLRMEEAARLAVKLNADYFTTTLSISPHKNADKINEIGRELEMKYGVKHLTSDFKKKDGFKQSVELSEKYGLYRQDFCGCIYSK